MRIGIVGIGGVGGYYGGKLALAYAGKGSHEVIFIVRGETLAAIREKGLRLISTEGDYTIVPTLASYSPDEIGPLDLVLFTMKSYGLDGAARFLAGNIHEQTIVLPLLNGVNIAERLRGLLPGADVLNGCVYINSHIVSPGVIEDKVHRNLLVFGPDRHEDMEKYRPVEKMLQDAGINAKLTENADVAIWTKYIFVETLAGVTSLEDKTAGAVLENEETRVMLRGMIEEAERVGRARGVNLPPDIVEMTMGKVASIPYDTTTSMQLDRRRGNPLELDTFSGYIARAGKELGIPTPLHDRVYRELTQDGAS